MQNKTAFGAITAATAAGVLLLAAPASAQTAADFVPDCASGVLAYAPGATAGAASNANPAPAEGIVLTSGDGSFDPGSAVTATFNGTALSPAPVVSPTGNASVPFTVPADPGTYIVIFNGTLNGSPNVVGVCFTVLADIGGVVQEPVTQPSPATVVPISDVVDTPAVRPAALPFTGSVELLTVAGLGAALVAAGAGTVVLARRRRRDDVSTA